MNWNWDHLRYFHILTQHGTLSAAARQLDVSHSTVQRHILALERELNVKLFNHTSNGYVLTKSGAKLQQRTNEIQHELEAISTQIFGADSELAGQVTLTVTDTIGHFLLPTITSLIHDRLPEISLSLNIQNQRSDIQNFEADIAIRTCVNPPSDLIGRKIGDIRFSLFAASDYLNKHHLNSADAAHKAPDLIQLDESFSDTVFHDWWPETNQAENKIRINGFLGAYRLCQAGKGLALLPSYIAQFDHSLMSIDCHNLPRHNELWLLSPAELRETARIRTIRQLLFEKLRPYFIC